MRRHLFILCFSALLLLLSAATLALCARSYWYADHLEHGGPTQFNAASNRGRIGISVSHPAEAGEPWQPGWSLQTESAFRHDDDPYTNGQQFRYRWLGFEWASYLPGRPTASVPGAGMRYWTVTAPHWFIALVTLAPALLLLRSYRRRTRERNKGLCPSCGYDLRASAVRCPECGRRFNEAG